MEINRAVVDTLVANGIDTAFGIPGSQSLPLNEDIDRREDIRFVVARHETAVSHQAWGYAETSGRPAATIVIPGPGDMNAMNGLKNALNDCTPLVHIAIETDPELRGGDAIHETPPDTYDNVVKENTVIRNPEATTAELTRAIGVARTAPKGPVRVGIPKGFLGMDTPLAETVRAEDRSPGAVPERAIERATELLTGDTDPVIIAGGGVRSADAGDPLRAVAERLGAPVLTTYKGKGVLPEDHDLSAGTISGSASPELLSCLAGSDVALAVGSDLDAHGTRGWSVRLPDSLVHVTLNPGDIGTGYEPTVGIVADVRETLAALLEQLDERGVSKPQTAARARRVRDATARRIEPLLDTTPPLTSVKALRTIRETLPRETIVAVDAGGFRVWGLNVFEAYGPRRYVNPGSWASMGTGVPSAIGAHFANPETPVVALSGDGGTMMCVHELHTIATEGLPITVVVFNNDDYAIISEEAHREYDLTRDEYAWGDTPIDFVAVADGMGLDAKRADSPEEIRSALRDALDSAEPTLLEVRTDPAEPQASSWMDGDSDDHA